MLAFAYAGFSRDRQGRLQSKLKIIRNAANNDEDGFDDKHAEPKHVSRSEAVRALLMVGLATFTAQSPVHAPAVAAGYYRNFAVLKLQRCGGAFCAEYFVDGKPFRAVVDTGSPFIMVDGSCNGGRGRWGCYSGGIQGAQGSLNDASEEGYGGQDVGVEWRRGLVRFPSLARPGASDLVFEPLTFGVVRTYTGKGGSGAIYLGLVKDRQPRIRPSLLEQTEIQGLRFDFANSRERTLTLSRTPLIRPGADAVPLVDLRPYGAPLATYAARVQRFIVNGREVELTRPCVAVFDTGTTGK